jgi:D-3-phosphoglycerate dehydrogenase
VKTPASETNAIPCLPRVACGALAAAQPGAIFAHPSGLGPRRDPMNKYRVLAAGDKFIPARVFSEECLRAFPTSDIHELEWDWPDQPFGDVAEVHEASGSEQELIDALQGCVALVSQLAPVTQRVLANCPSLKFVGVSRGGPVNVNLAAAKEYGVTVCNAPGRNATATAEMTIGLMLALVRHVPAAHTGLTASQWEGWRYRFEHTGIEIEGTTVGLIGYGAVARIVARILLAMGATVVVYDPYIQPGEELANVTIVSELDELFTRSTIVSVHSRLTEETTGIVSGARISLMPPGGYIVNAARGKLVDYEAVTSALGTGHLAGAAFDVFPTEPVDFSDPLFDLARSGANVVLTPHIAGASQQVARRAASIVADELARFFRGEELRNRLA